MEDLTLQGSPSLAPLDRRRFLRHLGIATGSVVAASSMFSDLSLAAGMPKKKLHVIILGAGLAGLCAAFELEKLGHRCTLLEADPRHLGGRVRTLRFSDGLYDEAGAMRIPKKHELTRFYVNKFGLKLRTFVQYNDNAYSYFRNHKARNKDVKSLGNLYDLSPIEQGQHPDDLWVHAVVDVMLSLTPEEQEDLLSSNPKTPRIKELDKLSLRQLLESRGLSSEGIQYLTAYYGVEVNLNDSATEYLREELKEYWIHGMDEIVGGMDLLPRAFADRLKSKPQNGCEVVKIEQDKVNGKVAAIYRDRNRLQRITGDRIICTLPFPVLQRLQIEPDFSPRKQHAIRTLHYDSATKTLAVCNTRFWEWQEGIYGGGTYTDLPTGSMWYPSNNSDAKNPKISKGPGVMLASYSWGEQARRLGGLPSGMRHDLTLQHISRIHPQFLQKGMVRGMASWAWDTFPLNMGAFAWFSPGQHTDIYRHIIAPEGRIHFAGEHASLTHTWMQGALESALRAVQEVAAGG